MDDSFRVRVDKIFGSLTSSSSNAPSLRSLWSLTDEEVEKREWNREREDSINRDETPCSSSFFNGCVAKYQKVSQKNKKIAFEDDLGVLGDEEEEEEGPPVDNDKEDWDVRSSIGLDPTLDHEEEEDEFDKVAVGRESAGDRMYMRDVTDYGPYLNSYNVVPDSFQDHSRDPRANISAARIRLKEDNGTPGSFDSENKPLTAVNLKVTEEDHSNLKSILKRKENHSDTKPQKRVRFDPEFENKCNDELHNAQDSVMGNNSMETTILAEKVSLPQDNPAVPDYVRNPSKYTRYSFDTSSEVDEESNGKAYMDFLDVIKGSKMAEPSHQEGPIDLPKSITFTPKKKTGEATTMDRSDMKQNQEEASKESISRANFPLGIAAIEAQENEACAMEEDEPQAFTKNASDSSLKPSRQYRLKVRSDDDVVS